MRFSLAQLVSFWATIAMYGVILALLQRKKLGAYLPVFGAYIMFECCRDLLNFYAYYSWSPSAYGWLYWAGELAGFALTYLLVWTFWRLTWQRFPGLWSISRMVLLASLPAVFLFLVWTTQLASGMAFAPQQWGNEWMHLLSRSVMFTQAALLLGLFLVLGLFRVPLAALPRRLALCWFVFSLVKIGLFSLRQVLGAEFQPVHGLALTFAFDVLLAGWGWVLWTCRPADLTVEPRALSFQGNREEVAGQLEAVNRSLIRLLRV